MLDATIVNIALPTAQHALHITEANRQWVITAYTLAFGGLLLLGGRIADFTGRKRAFIIGLIGFAAASALGGARANEGMLFGARALQGAFAALMAPAALSLLTVTFTDAEGAGQGVRRLRRDRRWRQRGRPAARRRADRVRVAGAGPCWSTRRSRSSPRWPRSACVRESRADGQHPLRRPRRDHLDARAWSRWSTASPRPRRPDGWGSGRTTSTLLVRRRAAARRVRLHRDCAPRTRCCRCAWCSTATAAARSCVACSSAPACSAMFLFLSYYLQQTLRYSAAEDRRRVPAVHRRRGGRRRRRDPAPAPDRARVR